jgi:hypothetical protein
MILLTQCICVFSIIHSKCTDYLPNNIKWSVLVMEMQCVCCEIQTAILYITYMNFKLLDPCHSSFKRHISHAKEMLMTSDKYKKKKEVEF